MLVLSVVVLVFELPSMEFPFPSISAGKNIYAHPQLAAARLDFRIDGKIQLKKKGVCVDLNACSHKINQKHAVYEPLNQENHRRRTLPMKS